MHTSSLPVSLLKGVLGAIVGGTIGYYLFVWGVRQGFYALALPGALVGIGCGYLSGIRSVPLGVLCALSAVGLGLFCQWHEFTGDGISLTEFLSEVANLRSMTKLMLVMGGLFGFWFGLGRESGVFRRRATSRPEDPPQSDDAASGRPH